MYVGAMQMGWGLLPRPAWVRRRRYQITYECHVTENCFEKGSDPLQPHSQVFLYLNPQKSISQDESHVERREDSKHTRVVEDIWRLSQGEEPGDQGLCHPSPSCAYSWCTQCSAEGMHQAKTLTEHRQDVQTARSSARCQAC